MSEGTSLPSPPSGGRRLWQHDRQAQPPAFGLRSPGGTPLVAADRRERNDQARHRATQSRSQRPGTHITQREPTPDNQHQITRDPVVMRRCGVRSGTGACRAGARTQLLWAVAGTWRSGGARGRERCGPTRSHPEPGRDPPQRRRVLQGRPCGRRGRCGHPPTPTCLTMPGLGPGIPDARLPHARTAG